LATNSFPTWVLVLPLFGLDYQHRIFSGEPESIALPDKFSGDNLLLQSISLLRVKDPLFKRMGASRLARFAVDGN
jgi:hypothetical protein